MNKEEFKQIGTEVMPLINQLNGVLKNHKSNALLSMHMSRDGYFRLSFENFELARVAGDEKIVLRNEEEFDGQL